VIALIGKCLGLIVDVDWGGIFKSFYEVVRVKLAVKDSTKIPEKRIVVMRKKFYQLLFEVERASSSIGNIQSSPSPPHDDGGGDDADFDDDEDDLLDNYGLEEGGRENADHILLKGMAKPVAPLLPTRG
jgi:hypothetical protein